MNFRTVCNRWIMKNRKFLPLFIGYVAAFSVFVGLLFVKNENKISVFDSVFNPVSWSMTFFWRGLASAVLVLAVILMAISGIVIAVKYFTGKADVCGTARNIILVTATVTAIAGIITSLRGMQANNYMVMELPAFMTYIILGNAVLIAYGTSGYITAGKGRNIKILIPHITAIVLYAAAFALSCVITVKDYLIPEKYEGMIRTLRCVFIAWTCARMTMKSAAFSLSAFHKPNALYKKVKMPLADEYVDILNYIFDFAVCAVMYIIMLSTMSGQGSADALPVVICFIVLTVMCIAALIFIGTVSARAVSALAKRRKFAIKITFAGYAAALSVSGLICAAVQQVLMLAVTYSVLFMAAAILFAVTVIYNEKYAESPMDPDMIIKIMRAFPPYFALRRIDEEAEPPRNEYVKADFAQVCDEVRALSYDCGGGISADCAAAAVAGIVSSRILYFTGDGAESAVRAIGGIFGEGTSMVSANSLIGVGRGEDFVLSAFMDTFYRSARYPDELRAVTLTGVGSLIDSPLLYNIKPEYGNPDSGFIWLGEGVPDKLNCVRAGKIKAGENVRFAFAVREQSYLLKEMLESAALINIGTVRGNRPAISPSRLHIAMGELNTAVEDARRKYRLPDAEKNKVTGLLRLLGSMGIRYDNDIADRFEIYTAVYRACGGSAEKAIDSAVAALILPCIFFADRSVTAYSPAEAVNAFGFPMPESMRMLRLADFTE